MSLGVVLRKEHVVNSCMGLGMANGETGVRFENDTWDKEWRAKDGRRHDKASNLVRLVAAILAVPDGEKRPGNALGEEVTTTRDAYREEHQGRCCMFSAYRANSAAAVSGLLECGVGRSRYRGEKSRHRLIYKM